MLALAFARFIIHQAINGTGLPEHAAGLQAGLYVSQFGFLRALSCAQRGLLIAIDACQWPICMRGWQTGGRLRKMVFERVMRTCPVRLGTRRSGEVAPSVVGGTEPLGGFVGEAAVTTVVRGGPLIAYHIVAQPGSALALYPVPAVPVPRLHRASPGPTVLVPASPMRKGCRRRRSGMRVRRG
ncbi:MAG: hypothetical protein AAF677_18010 [Pseudomonadota bacterium]